MPYYFFFSEIFEYNTRNEELVRNYNSNHKQNMLSINSTTINTEHANVYMRSELNCKPLEKTVCVLLTWTNLKMQMDSDFKKN